MKRTPEIKPSILKLCDGIDVGPAVDEILAHPKLWDEITARQEYDGGEHKNTESIFLRWCESQTVEAAFSDLEAIDYPASRELPECMALVKQFTDEFNPSKLGRVLLVALHPGGKIGLHTDEGDVARAYARFHIPLVSENENYFDVVNVPFITTVHMSPGELWWFNNKKVHRVWNASDECRVHLIIDAVVEGFE